MLIPCSRRDFFLGTVGAAASLAAISGSALAAAPRGIRYGYTAMTWGKDERKAMDEIAATGFEGIQFRVEATTEFKPLELRELLAARQLTFVALSSGQISLDPEAEASGLATHTANAKFVRDSGGKYLQILDQLKPYPREVSTEECKRLGKLLNELGKRTADLGIPMVYHNHMNTVSERPENLDIVMSESDPKYVKLLLDTAHTFAGGGDPAAAIGKYRDRLQMLHLKDVVPVPVGTPGSPYPFRFLELGRGKVDLPAVFAALDRARFQGWGVVELDRVPEPSTTPLAAARTSRKYLEEKIGVKFRL